MSISNFFLEEITNTQHNLYNYMKLKQKTIKELKQILKDEYNLDLTGKDLIKLAYSLVGLFGLLEKIESRHKFQNHPRRVIEYKGKNIYKDK